MTGVEINFITRDSLKALELYKKIFDIEVVEKTDFEVGKNEVIFTLYGTRFHMLDENPAYGLLSPKEGTHNTIWYNVLVEDIKATWDKAMENNCTTIQPVTLMEDFGVSNAMFVDTYGYVWMLHQLHEVKSYDERIAAIKKMEEQ